MTGSASHAQDAPLIFVVLIVLSLGALMGNMIGSGGLNAKVIATLGLLTATNAVLRIVPGPGGFSAMFALPILTGYCFGSTYGFLLGALSLAVSALLGAGIGPWMPYQMFALGWVGLISAWLPDLRRYPKIEVAMLAGWGFLSGLGYGFVMNVWFWPFVFDPLQAGLYWEPGIGPWQTLQRYWLFYVITSLWWDLGRSVGNAMLMVLFALPVLRLLRRFRRRFTFGMKE
jgi:energy-coupling factor transport system substrate-specific component